MRSSRRARGGAALGQNGIGLVEVVVASGLMGVALVVLLSNLSTVVIGGRVAERRIVEERLARNQMEQLFQASVPTACQSSSTNQTVDNITYTIKIDVQLSSCANPAHPHYVEYTVTAQDGSNAATQLVDDRWTP